MSRETLEVETAEKGLHPHDELGPVYCVHCADEIEIGQDFVWRPDDYGDGIKRIFSCHASCAVVDGFKLSWPSETQDT